MTATMSKRWFRSRRNQIIIIILIAPCVIYYISLSDSLEREPNLDITRSLERYPILDWSNRKSVIAYKERSLEQSLKLDKGSGCKIPKLDPFSKEAIQFDKDMPKIVCAGTDWVKCYHSKCRIIPAIATTTKNIVCSYEDIIYKSDQKYVIGPAKQVKGEDVYILTKSDHVKIKCTGKRKSSFLPSKWLGNSVGFRSSVRPKSPPPGREDSLNVLILGFDSTAKIGFIRRMPKSYKVITELWGATILDGYNIVGDGTPAALFPILTGKTELELPDVTTKMKNNGSLDSVPLIFYKLKDDGYNIVGDGTPAALFPILTGKTELELPDVTTKMKNNGSLDSVPLIFYKLKDDGYRTAYFEDMPWIETFRFYGFRKQPADHYLKTFYLEDMSNWKKWLPGKQDKYCMGDTPQYKLMLDKTDEFLRLNGKRYAFTFIADITHDDFNMISTADTDTAEYLTKYYKKYREDTLLIVMGDHGPRFAEARATHQGKLEERLPLMAIRLPDKLTKSRPDAEKNLKMNAEVLTTPHDIYATVLDVIDLKQFMNPYKIKGADLTRGLTLLEPIPKGRSCNEAGVEAHWCSCLFWNTVPESDVMYQKTAVALVDFINELTEDMRERCSPRRLQVVSWVIRARHNGGVLTFHGSKDDVGDFGKTVHPVVDKYQLKITVGPSEGMYEATVSYVQKEDRFEIDPRDISRINAYNDEPSCISATHPHLNKYCYCKK